MARDTAVDSRQEILRTAARLFQQRGYDATSMNDVAAALKLSKGGLYHHFQSKDEILFEIMNHAMEITQERVLNPVRGIADPEERLRALIRLHIEVVLSPRDREITVMLHENHPLPPALRKRINARKKGIRSLPRKPDGGSATGASRQRESRPACGCLRLTGHDQLDLPVAQAGRRTTGAEPDPAIYRPHFRRDFHVKITFASLPEIEEQRAQSGNPYREFLRVPSISAGLYVLPAGATDRQKPHREDEIYYVVRGRARFKAGSDDREDDREEDREVSAGDVIFVAAEVGHRFYDITEELAVLVFFAPAET